MTGVRARGPATRVMAAVRDGASTPPMIAQATDLPEPVVRAVLVQLERTGALTVSSTGAGCSSGGCGSCPVAAAGPAPCASRAPDGARVLELRTR